MQRIGEFTQTDRVYIILFTDNHSLFTLSSIWTSPEDPIKDHQHVSYPTEKLHWWENQLKNDKLFQLRNIDEIPESEEIFKQFIREANIKSQMDIPIFQKEKLIGCLGLNSSTKERKFSADEIAILRIFSEIISNVLQ